jgi:hypothetical protein
MILSKATEYMRHLEVDNRKRSNEIAVLKIQPNAFKILGMTRPIESSNGMIQDANGLQAIYPYDSRQPYQADAHAVNQAHIMSRSARPAKCETYSALDLSIQCRPICHRSKDLSPCLRPSC